MILSYSFIFFLLSLFEHRTKTGRESLLQLGISPKRQSERDVPRTFHTFEKNVSNRREEKGTHNSEQGGEERLEADLLSG